MLFFLYYLIYFLTFLDFFIPLYLRKYAVLNQNNKIKNFLIFAKLSHKIIILHTL